MTSEKKKRLGGSGWTVGGAADFLQLSPEEAKFIELKLALAAAVSEQREKRRNASASLLSGLKS